MGATFWKKWKRRKIKTNYIIIFICILLGLGNITFLSTRTKKRNTNLIIVIPPSWYVPVFFLYVLVFCLQNVKLLWHRYCYQTWIYSVVTMPKICFISFGVEKHTNFILSSCSHICYTDRSLLLFIHTIFGRSLLNNTDNNIIIEAIFSICVVWSEEVSIVFLES